MHCWPLLITLLGALAASGCAGKRHAANFSDSAQTPRSAKEVNPKLIVTPEPRLIGTVVKVNERAGFVVLNFPAGHLPAINVRMSLYRRDTKIGEVKISGPQLEDDVVADVLTGVAQVGDEARP